MESTSRLAEQIKPVMSLLYLFSQFDKSFLETQEMISKEVVDAIVDEKFNEKNCFLAFKVCMMLIKNNRKQRVII